MLLYRITRGLCLFSLAFRSSACGIPQHDSVGASVLWHFYPRYGPECLAGRPETYLEGVVEMVCREHAQLLHGS